jgi:hypothetical protein
MRAFEGREIMKRTVIPAVAIGVFGMFSLTTFALAQTRNASTKTTVTTEFEFPNDCTGELLDVTTKTVVSCHDQLRADGTAGEKCTIHEEVDAVGETSGVVYHGSSDFRTTLTTIDSCNFNFTNRGGVRLISPGSDVNLILYFDDIVRMENCVMTADIHLVSSDCRGSQ